MRVTMRVTMVVLLAAALLSLTLAACAQLPKPRPEPWDTFSSQLVWANGKLYWYSGYTWNRNEAKATANDGLGKGYGGRHAGTAIYDPLANSWVESRWDGTGPAMIDAVGDGPAATQDDGLWSGTSASFAYDDDADGTKELFLAMGYPDWGANLWRYDPNTDTWSSRSQNGGGPWGGFRRGVAAMDEAAGVAYLFGGSAGANMAKFNFATNSWTNWAGQWLSAQWCVGGIINGKLYVAGGEQNPGGAGASGFRTEIWECDLSTDPPTWNTTKVADLLVGVNEPGVTVYNNKMYICGGLQKLPDTTLAPISDIQVFDPAAPAGSRVTKLGDLPVAVHSCASAIDPATGTLYFGSGGTGAGTYLGPVNLDWSKTNVNVAPLVWQLIASNPPYMCSYDWWGNYVSGTVVDQNGQPVVGAAVGIKQKSSAAVDAVSPNLNGGPNPRQYVKTDLNGAFAMYVVDNAKLAAWAQGEFAPGWRATPDLNLGLVNGQALAGAQLQLGEPALDNLAQGKPVLASTEDPAHLATAAVDGNMGTAWWSSSADPNQWFILDLGSDTRVADITIWWGGNRALLYEIDALPASAGDPLNVANWAAGAYTTFYSITRPDYWCAKGDVNAAPANIAVSPGVVVGPIRLPAPVTARGLRIRGIDVVDRAYPGLYQIWELQVGTTGYSGNNIGDLKSLPDGTKVAGLTGKIVTGAAGMPGSSGIPSGIFYMEEPDRFAGMRVAASTLVSVGQTVAVSGTMATTLGGERYIEATSVTAGPGTALEPLGANTKTIAGVVMEGLLIKTAGTVRTVGGTFFSIADGYFKDGAEVETRVETGGPPGVVGGSFVDVKGAASRDDLGSRVILRVP